MSRSSFTTAWFFTVAICVLLFAYVLQVKENTEEDSGNKSSLSSQSTSRVLKIDDALSPEQLRVKNMLEKLKANVSKEQDLQSISKDGYLSLTKENASNGNSLLDESSDLSLSQEASPLAEEPSRSVGASRRFPEPNVLYSLKERQESGEVENTAVRGAGTIELMKENARKKGYYLQIDEKTLDVISVIDMKTGEPVNFSF